VVPRVVLSSKPPYTLNQKELEELKGQLNYLFNQGVYLAKQIALGGGGTILFVDKMDGKLTMCIDYCALNKIMIKKTMLCLTLMIWWINYMAWKF